MPSAPVPRGPAASADPAGLDEDVLGNGLTDREVAFQLGVPDRTGRRRRHHLAVVVVEVREVPRGQGESTRARWLPDVAPAGTMRMPERRQSRGGQLAPRFDPAARAREHQIAGSRVTSAR